MRLVWFALALAVLVAVPFLIWGDLFEGWFTGDAAIQWLRNWGPWGWLAVIALLVSDLVLPVPGTGVMSAAGYLYGAWIGGMLGRTPPPRARHPLPHTASRVAGRNFEKLCNSRRVRVVSRKA